MYLLLSDFFDFLRERPLPGKQNSAVPLSASYFNATAKCLDWR